MRRSCSAGGSDDQNLVVVAVGVDRLVDTVDKAVAVARQKWQHGIGAFLQSVVGEDQVGKVFGLLPGSRVSAQAFARDRRLNFPELVEHLFSRGGQRGA